jgi:hypothetical protein
MRIKVSLTKINRCLDSQQEHLLTPLPNPLTTLPNLLTPLPNLWTPLPKLLTPLPNLLTPLPNFRRFAAVALSKSLSSAMARKASAFRRFFCKRRSRFSTFNDIFSERQHMAAVAYMLLLIDSTGTQKNDLRSAFSFTKLQKI